MTNKSTFYKKIQIFAVFFFLQFILFFPLSFLSDFQKNVTHFIFDDFTQFILNYFFDKRNIRIDYSSDSSSMIVLINILLLTSLVSCIFIKRKISENLLSIFEYIGTLYISIILMKYGIDKIFNTQFPIPESNILFTRFGNLDKDILYWSTIGTSGIYNTIIGCIEFFTGILLLFHRTQFLGLLLAFISFIQIFIINIGFDISVKIFSFILLLMSIFLLRKNCWELLLKILSIHKNTFHSPTKFLPYKFFFKILIIGIVFIQTGVFYFNNSYFGQNQENDCQFSGAYEVTSNDSPYQFIFFHKDQYLIFMEKYSEKMIAYHYDIIFENQIILQDYQNNISKPILYKDQKNHTIRLFFQNHYINAKAIDHRKMNALQNNFHILID